MKRFHLALTLCFSLTAASCAEPFQRQAEEAISSELRDPESARFADVRIVEDVAVPGSRNYCGTMNARNAFGGYVGSRGVVAYQLVDGQTWDITIDDPESPRGHCVYQRVNALRCERNRSVSVTECYRLPK